LPNNTLILENQYIRNWNNTRDDVNMIFSSPGRRPEKLIPWRSVRRPSVRRQHFPLNDQANFNHTW